jgi:pimeloyl-ACP methyl ester carboxylesterase
VLERGATSQGGVLPDRERWVDRPDGATLCVQEWGATDAPTILILDGIGCSGWAFRRIIPVLATKHRVALMHYRGHGKSPAPPRPWQLGVHDLADDADASLAALSAASRPSGAEGAKAIVVGFSMGFQVALELYKRHRERVAGLVSLAGPSGRVLAQFQGTDVFGHVLPFIMAATRHASGLSLRVWRKLLPNPTLLRLGMQLQLNTERIEVADIEFYLDQMSRMSPELFMELLQEAARHCSDDVLPRIRVPTLVIAGGKDRFVPLPTMRRVAFSIPGAQWVVLPEASHALPAEYPHEIAKHVLRFADG